MRFRLHVLTCFVAVSYLTLGLANPDAASRLWWVYGLLTLGLAGANVWLEPRE